MQGHRDAGMQGCRDTGTQGCRYTGTQGRRDAGTQGRREAGMQGCRDAGMLMVLSGSVGQELIFTSAAFIFGAKQHRLRICFARFISLFFVLIASQ